MGLGQVTSPKQSAMPYPSSTDEKRWGDGVLARKKGLGF